MLIDCSYLDDGLPTWGNAHNYFTSLEYQPTSVQRGALQASLNHGLVHSYARHDSGGYLTWTQMRSGLKMWVFVRPPNYVNAHNRDELYNSTAHVNKRKGYGEECERVVVYARPGDLLQVNLYI